MSTSTGIADLGAGVGTSWVEIYVFRRDGAFTILTPASLPLQSPGECL